MNYKYCMVPDCGNSSIRTPNKLFIRVPEKVETRKTWLKLAGRGDADRLSSVSKMHFCEDHFDLPVDMLNYMQYHLMGKVKVRLRPNCVPTKFECQKDSRKRPNSSPEQPCVLQKQRIMTIAEYESIPSSSREDTSKISSGIPSIPSSSREDTSKISSDYKLAEENEPCMLQDEREMPTTECLNEDITSSITTITSNIEMAEDNVPITKVNKMVQTLFAPKKIVKFKSKGVQVKVQSKDQMSSPVKPKLVSSFTSPLNIKILKKSIPSGSSARSLFLESEHSDSDKSVYTPPSSQSPSKSSQTKSSSECGEVLQEDKQIEAKDTLLKTIKKIQNKPRLYLGIPNSCYYIVDIIKNTLNIPEHHLLFCLQKIRLDSTFNQLADDYEMTMGYLSKIFHKSIPLMASVMRPFIVNLNSEKTKLTLPMSFRQNFHNVSCIIDCLEIEVQKPTKAVNQALTWSEYKKANTVKYLVSCTPNGLINYISPGFGGRITDTYLVETSDFLKTLKPGMCVLADRGFKHIEQYLCKAGVTLVRPPSVQTGVKLSKSEARLTKQIASLRIHVERVIRRLREFCMLRPHACINLNFLKILDDILIIACGLVNLQDSLIK